jgi:hypothetical protein
MTDQRLLGPDDEPQQSGAVVAVNWGDYRNQQIFVSSGANIGNWYCLGGEFGRIETVEDNRSYYEKTFGTSRWEQPAGTLPLHPTWSDLLKLGPVTLLVPAGDGAYRAGWKAGRRAFWSEMEDHVDDEPAEEIR